MNIKRSTPSTANAKKNDLPVELMEIFKKNSVFRAGLKVVIDDKGSCQNIYIQKEKSALVHSLKPEALEVNVRSAENYIAMEAPDKNNEARNPSFDFLYFDIRTESISIIVDELARCYSNVVDDGIIAGNGYDNTNFPIIKTTIDHFFGRFDLQIHQVESGYWWVIKKTLSVSYIVPAYNCAATIKESLESIFSDNLNHGDEVVIVNDCSTDATHLIISKFKNLYPNVIRVIEHSENRGGAAARNTAVTSAENSLIFCLDSDNILVPKSIDRLKDYLIKCDADAAAFQELRYFNKSINLMTHRWVFQPGQIEFSDCLASGLVPISSGNYLYTKKSWRDAGGYPEFAKALDAWGFGLRQVGCGQKLCVLMDSWYFHRHGHKSYWVREHQNKITSFIALQVLEPFISRLSQSSLDYLSTEDGKNNWFNSLEKNPLTLKGAIPGRGGIVIHNKNVKKIMSKLFRFIRSYLQSKNSN